MRLFFPRFGRFHGNPGSAKDDGGMLVGPSFIPYGCARLGAKRIVDRTLRSLVGATLGLILTCAISILFVAHPVLSASQDGEEHLQKAIDELLDGRPLPAVTDASEAVEVDPQSAEALAILGLSQLKCGEWEKAEVRFSEAMVIDSLSPEAQLGLGAIAISQMRYRDAIPHLRRATSSQLFPGAAYRALASSLEHLNLHQEASHAMREASKYTGELRPDELVNARAFADIFAAYDGRSLYSMPKDFSCTSVQIAYSQDHITVPVVVNGTTRGDFVLDTGHSGSLMLSDEFAKRLDLEYVGEIGAISLDGELRLRAAILDSIEIGGLVMRDVPVFMCEDYPFQSAGLIGWEIIQKVNTTIDFEGLQIRLSSLDKPEWHGERITDEARAECVPFIYMTSMYVIARFGDDLPRAFVFDTGADASCLHRSDSSGGEPTQEGTSSSIRIGDLTLDLPRTEYLDFSAVHRRGRYYFPGVVGLDVLRHSVLHIFPGESMLCIGRDKS